MTQLPEPNDRTPRSSSRQRFALLRRFGAPIALVSSAAIVGGSWYGWKFVNQDLAPLVETTLSQLLNRPVKLGRVEQFSLNSLRFGRSAVPATATDRDRATVESVEVKFNPLQVLLTRRLHLDVTLNQPDVFLEQNKAGIWVETQIKQREEKGIIKSRLDRIRFQDAKVELLAFPKPRQKAIPVNLTQITGVANFFDNNRRIAYELDGKSVKSGTFDIKGESIINNGLNSNLNIRGQEFLVAEIDRLVKLPINLTQGQANGNVNVQLRPNQRAVVKGTAQFKDVTLGIPRLTQTFTKGTGSLQIDDTLVVLDQASAQLGKIPLTAQGKVDTEKGFDLTAQVKAVTVANFFDTFNVKLPFSASGEAAADVKVTGAIERPIITGSVRNTKVAKVDRIDISKASGNFRLDASTLILAVSNIQATPAVGGQVTGAGQLNLNVPQSIALNFQAQNLPGDAIATLYNSGTLPITVGRVNAQGEIVGRLTNVQTIARWQAPEARYPAIGEAIPTTGEVVVAGGNINFRNTVAQVAGGIVTGEGRTRNGRWEATVQAANLQANQLASQVSGVVNGNFQLAGSLTNPGLASVEGTGQVQLTGGNADVNANLTANAGRWQADTQIASLPLTQFSNQLRGNLSGDINATGSLTELTPQNVRANGQVRLSQGISLITDPIVARVNWDGQRLNIPQATAPGFVASGAILANLTGTPQITGLDLNVRTQGYALANLPIPRPPVTALTGAVDLDGRITGTPANPNVVADVVVRDLSLNGITFDPTLSGNLRLTPSQGFSVRVAGKTDRIALALDPNYRPRSLDVQRGEATLIGRAADNLFRIDVQQFPIDGFILPGTNLARFGGVAGRLSARLDIDLDRLRVVNGTASIAQLRVGGFRADQANTRFVNNNNVFRFSDTVIRQGDSQYRITGDVDLRSTPSFKGQVRIAQGKIESILTGLQFVNLADFSRGLQPPNNARAEDFNVTPVGLPGAPLLDQLRRFSEISALIEQNAQARQNARVPELADVRGRFNGTIEVAASLKEGVNANFDLRAQNVEWRPYRGYTTVVNGQVQQVNDRVLTAEEVIALGRVENGIVTLEPLRLQSGDARLNITGQFGGATQSGQLQAVNLPIEELNRLYPLPLGIEGKLNANITVSGTRTNPAAVGQLQVVDGTLNGTQVESATGNFSYASSRLNFGSNITIAGPEPITIEGSIPYQLLPDSVRPDRSAISLNLNVRNEGLAVLNLLTPQVAWRGGQGEVKLVVDGTLLRPNITGSATVANAMIEATALQEPLTNLTGKILFDRDRIRIESLQGQFSRGQVSARGVLPILAGLTSRDPDIENPVLVSLDRLVINRKGLYQGAVNGNITVRGSAFIPEIGGKVELNNGQVLLTDPTATAGGTPNRTESAQFTPTLNNLQLILGNNVQIVRAPIINFVASGQLTVNGTLNEPRPEGTIRLRSGQVNLFTTQFVLARGYPQTAVFERDRGLDPVLDIRLIASVPEVTRSRIPTPGTAEFTDDSLFATSLGALQTVRVQARATGPASQLFSNLALTSSPSRSRNEIIALLGGGFVNTLGRGDSTLGIANLAGSALLTNIQGFIGNTLGLSEFRLFPTLLRNEQRRSSSLGLAAEAGIDITRNLSASILRVLTADQPTQFGIRYRVNDSLLFRGSTDFSGDSRAVVEFETRF
jgi:translocation and assembly module TamB